MAKYVLLVEANVDTNLPEAVKLELPAYSQAFGLYQKEASELDISPEFLYVNSPLVVVPEMVSVPADYKTAPEDRSYIDGFETRTNIFFAV